MRYLAVAGASLALLTGLVILGLGPGTGSASFTQVHIVYVNDFAYCDAAGDTTCPNPYVIAIDPGEHMVFRDGEPGAAHSVTECANSNFTSCGGAGLFDSGIQDPAVGEDYFDSALILSEGTHYYRCDVHGSALMSGVIHVGEPSTPSATPSPSPAPTAQATPSPTPQDTDLPSPSPTAPADGRRGDLDCDGDVDAHDLEELLSHFAGVGGHGGHGAHSISGSSDCPIPGTILPGRRVGELNCDDALTIKDAMVLLYHVAGLNYPLPSGCPGVN